MACATHAICEACAAAHGGQGRVAFTPSYPATVNHEAETAFAARIAREVVGEAKVDAMAPPVMGGEDFSYMLQARPGAFIFIGNGDSAPLHNSGYDFNDDAIGYGIRYWVRLAQAALAGSKPG